MDVLVLSQWQFAITTVYHFFFVPLTLGLTVALAIMQTIYVTSGDEDYKKMAKYWGNLFLINFAMGVATGIVQEFQFGMNWSEYSRFMGDIFGAPLAIEALLAFYMESTFIGLWVFGWKRFSPKVHLVTIWLVAIGSNLSAIWILTANSFMQEPVGYVLNSTTNRAEMVDFFALIGNPHLWLQFPHVFFAGITQAAFFIIGISAWHFMKKTKNITPFKKSFRFGVIYGLVGVVMVVLIGHVQAQHLGQTQPMKLAAGEALWETESPASFSVFSIIDQASQTNSAEIKIPGFLSFLAYNSFEGEVKGIKDLQAEYETKYGPGNYIPNVTVSYWMFRIMVIAAGLMLLIALVGYFKSGKSEMDCKPMGLKLFFYSLFLPYIAMASGWIYTEMGRQPWLVFGLFKTEDGVSKAVDSLEATFSLIGFTLIYAVLIVFAVKLWKKYASMDMEKVFDHETIKEA